MTTENYTTGAVDRAEAARLLAEAEGRPPVSSTRDARVFAWFTAVIAVVMGAGTIAIMFSDWAMLPYAVLLFAVMAWQRRSIGASPRGSARTSFWGVVGSGVMVLVVVTGLHVIRTTIGLTAWWYLLGAVLVAVPGLIAAARIARRGASR
ncbi:MULTISPECIES: hypothetical protein [unclassified Dietzia]|uniref:hypothetical protein n=1 Tax=unclassified Dietzia TaxID=2617939 RepID=UPI000D1FFBC8|nr:MULTISPECIES: hypothetical protein [unclassified Dietzia]AVZ38550.1 hypothetical protein CT688_02695 [Dietzia sp. JS16-p6b]QGW23616.1 hypothetical protein GJR88_00866 [Dietzia sp. DQ12-45-1b]